jgi:hypothetical protein|tara:strand:+ start:184 stop:342 length:159 start_codon:yes stop_codon:yes gene_type:complete
MQFAKRFFSRYALLQAVKDVKEKYCPSGDLCEVVIMFTVCFGTMYLAMLPLL